MSLKLAWLDFEMTDIHDAWMSGRKQYPLLVRVFKFAGRYGYWFLLSLWCRWFGHDIEDCSSAGPDSGDMDHYCKRCGEYWSVPLY